MFRRTCVRAIALVFFGTTFVFGQVSTANLQGTVRDQSGAFIPGVALTVRNTGTGNERTTVTNESGLYLVPQLSVGSYEIRAELPGFRTALRSGITLTVGMQAVVDFTLTVGELREAVEVIGEAPLVQTASSDVSALVDAKTMRELPLNGRNLVQLAILHAGVAFSDPLRSGNPVVSGSGMRFNVNGARFNYNSFLLDGQDIQDTFNGTPASGGSETLGVDTLQEFEIKTANYSAEYSKSAGAVINAVTKSGTNDVHGSAFMFHRNDNLDARNFFDIEKPEFRRNQFGGTVGGPLSTNRTFYFAGYEAIREGRGFTRRFVVPTADALAGRLRNPATGQIEQVEIAPAVRPYLPVLFRHTPNGRDLGDGRAELLTARLDFKNEDFFVVRIDHKLSDRDSLAVRYSFNDGRFVRNAGRLFAPSLPSRNQYANVQEQKVFSPNLVNTLRAGYNRSRLVSEERPLVEIPNNLFWVPAGMGTLTIAGFSDLGNSVLSPRHFVLNLYDVSDTLAITRGNQLIKLGGNFQRFQVNLLNVPWMFGAYNFSSFREFLEGRPATFFALAPDANPVSGLRQSLVGLFFQDDFRASSRLTLNLGVRYEFTTVPTEVFNRFANLRGPFESDLSLGKPLYKNPSLLNFAPRVGLAWDVRGNAQASVRAGFGIFHSQVLPHIYRSVMTGNEPFAATLFMARPAFPNAFQVARANPTRNVFAFPFEPEQTGVYQWNLTVQHALPGGMVADVGYVGSRGLHLPRGQGGQDTNLAVSTIVDGKVFYPQGAQRRNLNFAQIRQIFFDVNSFYHGLQATVRRRVGESLRFQVSYTYAKSIDEASGQVSASNDFLGSPEPQNPLDIRSERAPSAFDQRHNMTANFMYDLPFRATGRASKLLNRWQLSGIIRLTTGFPFTVNVDGLPDRDRDLSTSVTRPNLVAGKSHNPTFRDPKRWFDPTAFSLPDPGFYGNLGRNTLRADGMQVVDLALIKHTAASDSLNVQFRAEVFNVLNHANFSVPSVRTIFTGNNPTPLADAGVVDSTATPARQIQLGLKFIW